MLLGFLSFLRRGLLFLRRGMRMSEVAVVLLIEIEDCLGHVLKEYGPLRFYFLSGCLLLISLSEISNV